MVTLLRVVVDNPAQATGTLYVLPICLVAVRWGLRGALIAAAASLVAYLGLNAATGDGTGPGGTAVRATIFAGSALVVGHFADRVRRADRVAAEELRTLLDSMHDAHVAMDTDGRIVAWNQAARELFGWQAPEILGRKVEETVVPERFRDDHRKGLATYLRTGEGPVLGTRLELPGLRRDGEELPVELTICAVGAPPDLSFHAFLHDISDRKEREEAQRETERLKSEFFALVSHELRTPLTSIVGYADVLADEAGDKLGEEGSRFLEVIKRNAKRLDRLVQDLLLVAQVEAGAFTCEFQRADLERVARDIIEELRPAAEAAELELDLRAQPVEPFTADPVRIGQVMDNLVSNAIKYTPAGGRAELRLARSNGSCVIEVADTGVGIDREELQHLFDRFFRAGSASKGRIKGVGLGLAITKAIVDQHRGEIEIESEPGKGTTFRVLLPMSGADEREATPAGGGG